MHFENYAIDIPFLRDRLKTMFAQAAFNEAETLIVTTVKHAPLQAGVYFAGGRFFDDCAGLALNMLKSGAPEIEESLIKGYRAKAFEHYAKSSDLDPAHYMYAFRAASTGRRLRWTRAVPYFMRAVTLEPYNNYAWYELALFQQARGEKQQAKICARNALAAKPDDDVAYRLLQKLDSPHARRNWSLDKTPLAHPSLTCKA